MLSQELIMIQDDVSWYGVEMKIVMSPNELKDSENIDFRNEK